MDYPIRLAEQLRAHLRALRKQRGLTQAQLGQKLGIGQVRVAEIEAKPGLVSVDQLIKILSALSATLVLRDLMGSVPMPSGKRKIVSSAITKSTSRPSTAKKSTSVASETRDKASRLQILPKKGSW